MPVVLVVNEFSRSQDLFYMLETKIGMCYSTCRVCNATKRILFLKTHKTGGSTITNIVNRFADRNNLTFALPHYKSYRFVNLVDCDYDYDYSCM